MPEVLPGNISKCAYKVVLLKIRSNMDNINTLVLLICLGNTMNTRNIVNPRIKKFEALPLQQVRHCAWRH